MTDVRPGYKRTEAGVIPNEWEAASVSSFIDRARLGGNYPNTDAYSRWPLIKMGNMGRGNIDLTKIAYVPEGTKVAKEYILSRGDVLFDSKYPPAKPGALGLEPLEAAEGVADAAP